MSEITKPYAFQESGIAQIQAFNGRALVGDSVGLGKTLQSIVWADRYLPKNATVAVVCPVNIKWNWRNEIAKHLGRSSYICEKSTPPPGTPKDAGIYILNYDILNRRTGGKKSWRKFLKDIGIDLLIGDEIHEVQNRHTAKSRGFRSLAQAATHVIGLSATPVTNYADGMWNILNSIRPDLYPSYAAYVTEHCKGERKPWGYKVTGAKNPKKLCAELKQTLLIRRTVAQVMDQLPPLVRNTVEVELPKQGMLEYREARDDFKKWMTENFPHRARRSFKAEQLNRFMELRRLVGRLKLPLIESWIDNYLTQSRSDKLIVFGIHKSVMKPLHAKYSRQAVLVDGSVVGRDRQQAVENFLNERNCRLFFGNEKAAGAGWSAPGVRNTLFVELAWNPATLLQCEGRTRGIARGEAGKSSLYHYLIARGTVESKLCDILYAKYKDAADLLDGGDVPQEDVFDLLSESILTGGKS